MSSTLDVFRRNNPLKKRAKKQKIKKSNFTMTPLLFLARKVAIERDGRPMDMRTVTKALVNEYRYAFNHNSNVTCAIVGGPGKGKSKFGFLFGKQWIKLTKIRYPETEFKYCWDVDEIPVIPDGGFLHIDEWLIPEGPGRIIALTRVKNRFDTCRALQISISVSTPSAPNLPFISFEATALAQNFIDRQNMFEIRVPLPRYGMVYIGNVVVPLGKDDDLWNTYEAESRARKAQIWEDDGAKTIREADTKGIAKDVLKWVTKQNLEITTKGLAETFVREYAKENNLTIKYYEIPNVVNWCMILKEGSIGQEGYTGQVKDLKEALFTRIIERGVNKEHVEWMKYYIKGNTQTDIATKFKVTQEAVSQAIGISSKLRLSVLGKSFEDVWAAKLKADGLNVRKAGGNSPEPDIVILDETGEIIEVQSLKCQITKSTTTTINADKIAHSEEKLRQEGKPLKLVFFDVVADKVHIIDVDGRDKYTIRKNK